MAAKKPRILVADDQRGMRLTLSAIIEDQGYDVTAAEDGYQALNAVKPTFPISTLQGWPQSATELPNGAE